MNEMRIGEVTTVLISPIEDNATKHPKFILKTIREAIEINNTTQHLPNIGYHSAVTGKSNSGRVNRLQTTPA